MYNTIQSCLNVDMVFLFLELEPAQSNFIPKTKLTNKKYFSFVLNE